MKCLLKFFDPMWMFKSMKKWLLFRYRVEMLYVFGNECNKRKNFDPTIWDVDSMHMNVNQFLSTVGLWSIRKYGRYIPMIIFLSLFKNVSMKRKDIRFCIDVYSTSKGIAKRHIENPTISDVVGLVYFTYTKFWKLRTHDDV